MPTTSCRIHLSDFAAGALAASILFAAGCAGLMPKPKKPESALTPEQQQEIRAAAPELLADAETASSVKGDQSWYYQACVMNYVEGVVLDKRKETHSKYQNCRSACTSWEQAIKQGSKPPSSLAPKYLELCMKKDVMEAAVLKIQSARDALKLLAESACPLDWRNRARYANQEVTGAEEILVEDSQDARELRAEYDRLVGAHKNEIDKVEKFLAREDIVGLETERDALQQELAIERKKQKAFPTVERARLINAKQARLDFVLERYEKEFVKAGMIKK